MKRRFKMGELLLTAMIFFSGMVVFIAWMARGCA